MRRRPPVRCVRRVLAACALAAATAPPASASEADAVARHLRESPRLLGDPAGLRGAAERHGLTLQLYVQQLGAWRVRGGADRGRDTGYSGSADLLARLDLEELLGLRGLTAFLQVKAQYDEHLNREIGAFTDPADDADFDAAPYVDRLWAEQSLFGGRGRVRAGFLELQTVFDRNAYANSEDRQFMNSALDNDPLVPLPNALGATLVIHPLPPLRDRIELAVGVADADNRPRTPGFDTFFDDAESLTSYAEAALRTELGPAERRLPGSYRIGGFRDGRERVEYGRTDALGDPRRSRGHYGVYASLDQRVWRAERGSGAVGVFARAARADPGTSPVEWFWSAGLEWAAPWSWDARGAMGLAAYQAIASDAFRDATADAGRRETGFEVYHRFTLLPWLSVTPDVQYILDPGPTSAPDALVLQLRLRVSL